MPLQLALAAFAVLAIIFVVPMVVYGLASRFVAMPSPEGPGARRFLLGVLVTKSGTAVAFVGLFWLSRDVWDGRWLVYAALWFVMFVLSEIGDAISGRSTPAEAAFGIVAEAVYAPLSAWVVSAMLSSA